MQTPKAHVPSLLSQNPEQHWVFAVQVLSYKTLQPVVIVAPVSQTPNPNATLLLLQLPLQHSALSVHDAVIGLQFITTWTVVVSATNAGLQTPNAQVPLLLSQNPEQHWIFEVQELSYNTFK